jgi:hypothetical protein
MTLFMLTAFFISPGCGGGGDGPHEADDDVSMRDVTGSKSFSGYVVVHIDESIGARLGEDGVLYSENGDGRIEDINGAIEIASDAEIERPVSDSYEKMDFKRAHLESLTGQRLPDWNSIYYIKVRDPDDAAGLATRLSALNGVVKAYPSLVPSPDGLSTAPALDGLQGYLSSDEEFGGIGAKAVWADGVLGAGVFIVFQEAGVNFGHKDLNLSATSFKSGGNVLQNVTCAPGFPYMLPEDDCVSAIAHGTAGAGIAVADHDGHGVSGIAPEAYYLNVSTNFSGAAEQIAPPLLWATDGVDEPSWLEGASIEPGTIWVVPMAISIAPHEDWEIPIASQADYFAAIQYATAYGVTVIISAGNSGSNLDSASFYSPFPGYINLSEQDSGAILVGASEGENHKKADFSNCGSPVNLYSWGAGVVTSAYPHPWYEWSGDSAPANSDDDDYYTDGFGGTSSAAAIIGGVAALVQSHVKGALGAKRFLMPAKMREILAQSGVPQSGSGCNIGVQPRADVAMGIADEFISQIKSEYGELQSGQTMTFDRMKSMRDAGLGIICKKFDPAASDSACPADEIYPDGNVAADTLDFDGDKRADLVQWTNGTWKLDLSGTGDGGDNYGKWDIELEYAPIDSRWATPYVEDMNSDGRADFVVYDKEHGKWYIRYTDASMLKALGLGGKPWKWDKVVDYSDEWVDDRKMDEGESNYSRPAVADANDDGWLDISIACSDGYWRIDFGGPGNSGLDGIFDMEVKYLSDEQLEEAPGWAYLTSVFDVIPLQSKRMYMITKVPDGLADEGRVMIRKPPNFNTDMFGEDIPHAFGGNDKMLVPGRYGLENSGYGVPSVKEPSGTWLVPIMDTEFNEFLEAKPGPVYGGVECHPIAADFDGDGLSDYTVMCPNEWKIMYSDPDVFIEYRDGEKLRHVPLGYDTSELSLPGRAYPGGLSYRYVKKLIAAFKILHPGDPPPIPVDAVTVSSEY